MPCIVSVSQLNLFDMPKLFHLHIENFRGIQKLDHTFKDGITCIIGRGDSGKTTILDAISYALTPTHTLTFHDGDFFNCDISKPIVIEVTVTGLYDDILRRFDTHMRAVKDEKIITSMLNPETHEGCVEAVTIQLKVEKDLEPQWFALGTDGTEPKPVRASERELFNCFYISEYNDRHFTLSKGTPLSTLFKQKAEKKVDILNAELIADLGRNAKKGFEEAIQSEEIFAEVVNAITQNATDLGLKTGDVKASLDQREFLLRENKIALHQDNVPLRQLGKGSKRLLSLAIQLSLTNPSGIILIDEIEQGLEPDRIHQVVSQLASKIGIQIIITTHSQHVVEELDCCNLYIKSHPGEGLLKIEPTNELQGLVRKHPLALFAKSIIIGEGATEYGFIRGLNEVWQKNGYKSMSFYGVCAINGNGNECIDTAKRLNKLGYRVALLCDSDVSTVNVQKMNLQDLGVTVYVCEDNLAFETQIFKDSPWDTVKNLINYRIGCDQTSKSVFENIKRNLGSPQEYSENWFEVESDDLRLAIGKSSGNTNNPWFKKIGMGYDVALIVMKNFELSSMETRLYKNISDLRKWIETR